MSETWATLAAFRRWQEERNLNKSRARVTMVIDRGLGLRATKDILSTSSSFIDHWKFSFGTSMVYPARVLRDKLALVRAREIVAYPGGTLFEACALDQQTHEYLDTITNLGFNAVEISDGTIDVTSAARREAIAAAIDRGLIAVTEVGKKNPYRRLTPPEVAERVLEDFEAGAHHVVMEGRESGKGVGLYDEHGEIDLRAVDEVRRVVGDLTDRIIWEAPLAKQQASLIRKFGVNVGLGNVPPGDVVALEALRARLRFETLEPIAAQARIRPRNSRG